MRISDWSSDVCSSDLDTNFRDLDVVLFGPEVVQASAIFDAFWNSEAALPISALSKASPEQLANAVARVKAEAQGDSAKRYYRRMDASETVRGYFRGELTPHWRRSIEVASDPPLKRSEERRVGKECDSTGRSRGWPKA